MQNNKQHIPDGWAVKRLDSLASIERGKFSIRPRNDPSCYGGDIPFVQTGDIAKSDFYLNSFSQTLNQKGLSVSKLFPAGTILITIAANIGDTAITTFPVACPDSLVAISGNKNNLLWLNYVLKTHKNDLISLSTQNAQKNINLEILKPFQILTPTVLEQEKIAEILGHWDSSLELLDRKIGLKKQQKKYLMQQLLTGTTRLSGFTKPWHNVQLGDIADLYQPQTISQNDLKNTGYPVFGANGLIGYYNKHNHETWQIMITCRGSTCGTVNRTYGKSWITGNAMVINCDNYDVDKMFLYYMLLNNNFSSIISGSGQPQIVRTPLNKWALSIPDALAEQTAIANILTAADDEIKLLECERDLINQQKQYLMQNLLTGQIRVKINETGE